MAHMETKSFACDIGVLVGHAPVRTWVMGAKANASDIPGGRESAPLNDEDIARMRKVVQEAVAAGAVGFSSSRVSIHRDASGVLLPGSLAEHKELEEMAQGVADGGGGVFELASSWNLYDDFVKEGVGDRDKLRDYYNSDWEWLNRMATTPGLTVTTGGGTGGMEKDQAWQFAAPGGQMERLANVHANGGDMWITPMMRLGTLFIGIKGEGLNPLLASAAYQEVLKAAGGYVTDDMIMELQSNLGLRATIIDELEQVRTGAYGTHFIGNKSQRQWIWPWSTDPENAEEDSLLFADTNPKVWGGEGGKTVWEYVYDVMVHPEEPHGGVLVRPLYNYGDHSFEPLMDMFLGNDKIVAGFADGGAHGKGQCEATTPTTLITFWCRDRTRGEHIPIEIIVKKQTKDSANMMGFHDRGELRPGFRADVTPIDAFSICVLSVSLTQKEHHDFSSTSSTWRRWTSSRRSTSMTCRSTPGGGCSPSRAMISPCATVSSPSSTDSPPGTHTPLLSRSFCVGSSWLLARVLRACAERGVAVCVAAALCPAAWPRTRAPTASSPMAFAAPSSPAIPRASPTLPTCRSLRRSCSRRAWARAPS